jgi:hypothetical protein
MSTATLPAATRPLPTLPGNAFKSHVWRSAPGEPLVEHDVEMPVDKATMMINGTAWVCPEATCTAGEWVIASAAEPKKRGCADHLLPFKKMVLDPSAEDPMAGGKQRLIARLNRQLADRRRATADRIRAEVDRQLAEARRGLNHLAAEMIVPKAPHKGHLPSIVGTIVVEVGAVYTVNLAGAVEAVAIGAAIGSWGAIVGYLLATWAQREWTVKVRKREWVGRKVQRAHDRGRYVGKAMAGAGGLLTALGLLDLIYGLDPRSVWQMGLLAVLGLGVAWVVNRDHWDRLWAARRRIREMNEQRARAAAEAEARRLEAEARRLEAEARLREQLAEVSAYDDNNPEHQGERLRIEWERIGGLATAAAGFPKIRQTRIVPARTKEVTAPDPDNPKKVVRIGWEYIGVCEPGALVANGGISPIVAAKEWIVSVLFDGRYSADNVAIVDKPENQQNTFMIMLTDGARLGAPVLWKAETAVEISDGGNLRTGYLGRSLTGQELHEVLYQQGQPFGGMVTGSTGTGKGGFATRHLLNLLLARIFPIVFDPKEFADFGDFVGLIPMGFTKRHRRMILRFLHLERSRRQKVGAASPKVNRYGAKIDGESKWQHRHDDGSIDKMVVGHDGVERNVGLGEPLEAIFDEFHDLAKDQEFILDFTNHVRFQRGAGMGALVLSQGGGLTDWGDSNLRDNVQGPSLTNFRSGEMQARMAGNRNGSYSVADLPKAPGMCLREAAGTPPVPLRAAYIGRGAQDEDTIYTTLYGKGAEKVLQIEDPMTWLSVETIELMKETGVWDLWMLAKKGGINALLADTAEDEEEDAEFAAYNRAASSGYGASAALTMPQPKQIVPKRLDIADILLAILHESPGLDLDGILAHDGWARAGRPAPTKSVLDRAARRLDPTEGGRNAMVGGLVKKIDRGPNSKSWTILPVAGKEAAQLAARLAPRPAASGPAHPGVPAGMTPAQIADMAAQRAAEMQELIAAEAARAARA